MIGIRSYSKCSSVELLVIASPRFDECEDLLRIVKAFDGIIVLCGDLSECYELLTLLSAKKGVGVPSLLSDVYEIKVLRELGALAMGRWIQVGSLCLGGVDARNVGQCLEGLSKELGSYSCIARVVISTQRLGYEGVIGYPRAEEVCESLSSRVVVVCGLGKDFCSKPRVSRLRSCVAVEACCRPATLIRLDTSRGVDVVDAECLELGT